MAGAEDSVLAMLPAGYDLLRDDPDLGPLCAGLVDELRLLKTGCERLAPRDRTPLAGPNGFELAERYTLLLAAAACLGVWLHQRDEPQPFPRDSAWLTLALRRLTSRLGHPLPPGTARAEQAVFAELVRRERENRSFDLSARPFAPTGTGRPILPKGPTP